MQNKMKPEIKIITIGAGLCLAGAILLDCHIVMTGWTLMSLGGLAITFGPAVIVITMS